MNSDSLTGHEPSPIGGSYQWDHRFHLFRRTNVKDFVYSDGQDVEERLLAVVSKATDRSTFSKELSDSIIDWPSEYHLSRARHCLVRPLGIRGGDKVLELGCGCGAITRYLGEMTAEVVAVEGSLNRARVAAERCRGLSNVRIVADDLLRFNTAQQFDWILLIGVLEYAALFSDQDNPTEDYLRSVTRLLAPGGRVVVAIENKLGLKYFNGCSEDHVGIPFYGVQNLYGTKTAQTFGRQELIEQLSAVGLASTYFLYPFPDYKLPSVILSEDALTDPEFDPTDLLARCHARDYAGSPLRSFDDALAFSSLLDNGLLADLSNSFLVVATPEPLSQSKDRDLAVAFSANNRSPEFATQTRFIRHKTELKVIKESLTNFAHQRYKVADEMTIESCLTESDYYPGRQVLWPMLRARARSGDVKPVVQSLRGWMDFLLRHSRVSTSKVADSGKIPTTLASYVLPPDFLDCTPFNLLDTGSDLVLIDCEWLADSDIPLGWVVTRGILWSLTSGVPVANHIESAIQVIQELSAEFHISVSKEEIQAWMQQEARFQTVITGNPCEDLGFVPTSSGMRSVATEVANLGHAVATRDQQIVHLSREAAERDNQIVALSRAATIGDQQIGTLNRTIADIKAILTKRETKIVDLNHSLAEVRAQSEEATNQLDQLRQREQSQAKTQIEVLQNKLAIIEASTIWQGTAALRNALARHPRIRKVGRQALRFVWWTLTLQLLSRMRDRRRLFRSRDIIAASDLFDSEWYLRRYLDVAANGWDPALHYALFGASENRDPGPLFDGQWYLQHASDVAQAGLNPLLHYLQKGKSEGRETRRVEEVNVVPATSPAVSHDYAEWVKQYDTIAESDIAAIRHHIRALREVPLISIVVPVFNPAPDLLRKTLDSVIAQLYPRWELCIADDASSDPDVSTTLAEYARRDRRIKVVFRPETGGTSAAGNSALTLVNGDFVALLKQEDELSPLAMYMVAAELNQHSQLDIIYSDEDKITEDGVRCNPCFKTSWDPELFYTLDIVSCLGVYRSSLIKQTDGFRRKFEPSHDYDLALRILRRTGADRIAHIPRVLYHRRVASNTSLFPSADGMEAVHSARQAVEDYFASQREVVQVICNTSQSSWRLRYPLPDPAPRISLIIPTRDKVAILRRCVDGILHKTRYPNMEIIIVDNESSEPATLDYLLTLQTDSRFRILRIEGQFNYAALNNQAVEKAEGEFICLINNDVEVIDPGWLEEMIRLAVRPGVGAVGAKLYYQDNTIQHAGVVLGMIDVAAHNDHHAAQSDAGHSDRLEHVRNVSAVTAACMVVPKSLFVEVGGLDEVNLKVAYNDVDLCLRLRRAGYNILWTPYAELYHLESASRGYDDQPQHLDRALQEAAYMKKHWSRALSADPFYSPNLTLAEETVGPAFPPRISNPWNNWNSDSHFDYEHGEHDQGAYVYPLPDTFSYMAVPIDYDSLPEQVAIGVSSLGNHFMTEIGRMLQDAFAQLGVRSRVFTESEAASVSREETVIVVAPHEFLFLGSGPQAFEILKQVATPVMVNTEQQQTPWFAVAEPYLRSAYAVLDINHQSARQLVRDGYRAFSLPLGFSEYVARSFDGRVLPDREVFKYMPSTMRTSLPSYYSDRPIDVLFVGTASSRRQEFLAQQAEFLSDKNTFIYIPDGDTPFQETSDSCIDFSSFVGLARRSKILLNVHRDNVPYLESQRIMTLGIMQKTLVVSESCQPSPWVKANSDYLEGPLEALPALCEFALTHLEIAEDLTERAYTKLKTTYPMAEIVGKCWTALAASVDTVR